MDSYARMLLAACLAGAMLVPTGCNDSDDDDGASDGGSDLPNGGTATSPVGRYIGYIDTTGYSVDESLRDWMLPGATRPIAIGEDLVMQVGADDDPTGVDIPLTAESDGETWTASMVETDGADSVTMTFTLTYDATAERWRCAIDMQRDVDGDGVVDATGTCINRMAPCVDLSAYAGTWHACYTHTMHDPAPASSDYTVLGDGSGDMIETVTFDADGSFTARGETYWCYRDGAEYRFGRENHDDGTLELGSIRTLESDYAEITLTPYTITTTGDSDPTTWDHYRSMDAYLVPTGRLADFAATDVAIASKAGSQIDHDTDGADAGDGPYFYFGTDMTGLHASISVSADGTATVTPPAPEEPFSMPYGYQRVDGTGYLVMLSWDDDDVGELMPEFLVFELDADDELTGNGVLQGFDLPDSDDDGSLSNADWAGMDNEGLLQFGDDGVDGAAFDYIVTSDAEAYTPKPVVADN